jgi:Domain of unknown function (DUF397)
MSGQKLSDQGEPPREWRKSSRSGDGDCVQVALSDGQVLLRDSKDPAGPQLSFTPSEWRAFMAGVDLGEFTLGDDNQSFSIAPGIKLRGRG